MKSQRLIVQMGMTLVFTVITIVAVEAYVTDGLVSYYTLDKNDIAGGTVKDVAGGKDGKIIGAPKTVAGRLGDALEFGGKPDCVELPSIVGIGTNPVTYEAWFKKKNKVSWQYLLTNKTNFSDHFFRLGFNQDSGQIRIYTEQAKNVRKAWITDEDYADDKWHHVVATRTGAKGAVYVDGVLVKEEETMAGDIGGGETNWYIAQDGNKNGYLIGAMDEVRVYSRALTEAEIRQNFASQGVTAVHPTGKLSLTWGKLKASQSYR